MRFLSLCAESLLTCPSRMPPNRIPAEHRSSELELTGQSDNTTAAKREPFIYNPTKSDAKAKGRSTVVQDEPVEVVVTLQNPFLFDLEIKSIELR